MIRSWTILPRCALQCTGVHGLNTHRSYYKHHITQIFGNRKPNAQRVQCHELLAKLTRGCSVAAGRPTMANIWLDDGEQGDVSLVCA